MNVTIPVELFFRIWHIVGMAEAVLMIENSNKEKVDKIFMDLSGELQACWLQAAGQHPAVASEVAKELEDKIAKEFL